MSCINCDSCAHKGFAEHVHQENNKCFCVIGKYNEKVTMEVYETALFKQIIILNLFCTWGKSRLTFMSVFL